jgi:1-acyl-sn-glycerol-3-phosphate acyltransferase
MRGQLRHVWFYSAVRHIVGFPLRRYFRFRPEPLPALDAPYILVANHNTDFDSLFLGVAFPKHMYFVASEHIFRVGWLRKLLVYFLNPIPKRKGGADVNTAMQMVRRIRGGNNIALFAEGNKSFHGVTCPVHPATGTLVKASGASLVTYRLEGGYFTSPRWAHTLRRGKIRGHVVGRYSAQTLSAMDTQEINRLIQRDIHEDAYERQREDPVAFRGRRLAQGIQNALYLCPRCHAFGSVYGADNKVLCSCGVSATYAETGNLLGENAPFATLKDWGEWQREYLRYLIKNMGDRPLFSDEGQTLMLIHPDHRTETVTKGTLSIGQSGLSLGTFRLPLAQLEGLEIYGRNTVVFSDGEGNRYQVVTETERSGLKYYEANILLREALN